ncbi:Gfo/Idh/MocA family protein [uncultured Demequina sp.]|uniref:Gfo/Idh/MocA family protein n=1 Tax=uncultured Demequina sp. TaxID=693499 RepID=UPI0025DD25D1|nr:Gfo/Idh/MocA family oxidoreductase [uncultured Demequina sp.]
MADRRSSAPSARLPGPEAAPALRWGVIGAGWIADVFARSLLGHTASRIRAVASRDAARGDAYSRRYDVPTVHSGKRAYERLVADPDVDAVYIATPHSHHRDHALLAVEAGKPVLVEKAFARNATEAREVLGAASARGTFVMEAVWTRFLPHMVEARRLVAEGAIGRVVHVSADFGGTPEYDPRHRNFNPELAGGALLDLGVYPINLVHDFLGAPESLRAAGALAPTGVDLSETVLMDYPSRGAQGVALSTFEADTARVASIAGTEGRIDIHAEYYRPSSFTLTRGGRRMLEFDGSGPLGWQHQFAEVARCVADGATESAIMPHSATLEIMDVLDEVRRQLGVVYPGE